mgnify:CR=1 FL=1
MVGVRKGPMQVAGNKCKVCGRNIALSTEGRFCAHCEIFVHAACAPQDNCDVCGRPLECEESPKADPIAEATLPRALRPSNISGPLLALAALILFLVFLFFYNIIHHVPSD